MLWIMIVVGVIVVLTVAAVLWRRRLNTTVRGGHQGDSHERNKVYIGNLNYRVRESDLKSFFSNYGVVDNARVVRHAKTRKSQGFAFLTFSNASEATKALRAHGQTLQGRTMVVRLAKER